MACRFKRSEAVDKGLRRILKTHLDAARREISRPRGCAQETVHRVRKRFRRARSLLRLLKDGLPGEYPAANCWLRDESRRFSAARDAVSILDALRKLPVSEAEESLDEEFVELEAALRQRRSAAAGNPQIVEDLRALEPRIAAFQQQTRNWTLEGRGARVVSAGLARCYRQARHAFASALLSPTPQALHEWRKRCKDFAEQLRLLRDWTPRRLVDLAPEAAELCALLGDEHDLAVLDNVVRGLQATADRPAAFSETSRLIAQRRGELQQSAFSRAEIVFSEKPGAFKRRYQRYWERRRRKAVSS